MNTDERYRLSTYKDISLLSEDKRKTIYIVKDEVTNRLFIKKVFHNTDCFNFYKRLATLEHKNLTAIHEVVKGDNEICVIEDYISGQTLKALLEHSGVLPEKEVINYILQVCDALIYLHSQSPPIIHRDIKPENIICSTDNIVKLVDFDIAREFKHTASRDTVFMGTKEYAAPEQYGYKQTDCRTDIFSVGVLLHELIAGRLPENNITYKGALRRIIDRCVELDPDKRFQSVVSLKKSLTGLRLVRHKRAVVLASAMIIALTVLTALYFFLFTQHKGHSYDNASQCITLLNETDLQDLFKRITLGKEKPSILLENEAINETIRSITGDLYDDVTNALQEYTGDYPYPIYYDPGTSYLYVPACNLNEGYIHDMLLFEMDREFLSIAYFDSDIEITYYFTTNEDKGLITPDAFSWITKYHYLYENPVVFNHAPLSTNDILGVYLLGGKGKIEIFYDGDNGYDGNELKFAYTNISRSNEAEPLFTATIYKIDDNHYWIKNITSGNKNRLIFNFSENHLTLFSELRDEMLYIGGIYNKSKILPPAEETYD